MEFYDGTEERTGDDYGDGGTRRDGRTEKKEDDDGADGRTEDDGDDRTDTTGRTDSPYSSRKSNTTLGPTI